MGDERAEIARTPLVLRPGSRRRVEERVAVRFPRLRRFLGRLVWRLPASSRFRRAIIRRAVRRSWESFNRGDLDVTFALYHTECVSVYPASFTPLGFEPGTHDLETRMESQRRIIDEWEEMHFEGDELIEIERDRLVTTGRMKAVGPGSGVTVETPWIAVLTTHDGQVIREELFVDRAPAFAAAGIPE